MLQKARSYNYLLCQSDIPQVDRGASSRPPFEKEIMKMKRMIMLYSGAEKYRTFWTRTGTSRGGYYYDGYTGSLASTINYPLGSGAYGSGDTTLVRCVTQQ